MKKLLVVFLLFIGLAHADTAATFQNAAGGLTVLTDLMCSKQSGFYVYSQNPRGRTQFGCWWSDDSMVHITWADGDFRSYPFSALDLNIQVLDRMRSRQNKGTL